MIPARPSAPVMRFFDRYLDRYLRREFHRVSLWGRPERADEAPPRPRLFAVSHTSWWDVLVGYLLARRVVGGANYAPMDEAQLARYRILSRLGVYSVDRGSARGLREFLAYTTELLREGRAVWITPQGEITSARRRPIRFQTGIGHLVRRVSGVVVCPVAIAYEFLEEPRPEIFVKFGPPRVFSEAVEPGRVTHQLERDLEAVMDALEAALVARDLSAFAPLLEGHTSVSLVYDRVRRVRAWLRGVPDPPRHGDVVSDPRRSGL
jgi:1-acyl-sn-glycerol-3-phosphate acyltransferase